MKRSRMLSEVVLVIRIFFHDALAVGVVFDEPSDEESLEWFILKLKNRTNDPTKTPIKLAVKSFVLKVR